MTITHFAGWDVAGWSCRSAPPKSVLPAGKTDTRDALVVLTGSTMANLVVLGAPAWTNFRSDVLAGRDFVSAHILAHGHQPTDLVLAIDAPLAWPDEFATLLAWKWRPSQSQKHEAILWRASEMRFAPLPQSAVSRSVGVVSTKALAYLQGQGFSAHSPGVFARPTRTAIETYPAALKRAVLNHGHLFGPLHASLVSSSPIASCLATNPRSTQARLDIEDALWCALVAAAFRLQPQLLTPPPAGTSPTEGWIWAP